MPGRAVIVPSVGQLPQRVVGVLGAQVLPPLGDHEEAPGADGAHVRVLVGVDADLVALHVAQVAEAQRAVGALVGLLPRVGAQVHAQRRVVHEGLAAVRAPVRLLLDVRPQVDLQVAGAGEAQAADVAHVGALSRVGAHVGAQVARIQVALVALGAHLAAPTLAPSVRAADRLAGGAAFLRLLLPLLLFVQS